MWKENSLNKAVHPSELMQLEYFVDVGECLDVRNHHSNLRDNWPTTKSSRLGHYPVFEEIFWPVHSPHRLVAVNYLLSHHRFNFMLVNISDHHNVGDSFIILFFNICLFLCSCFGFRSYLRWRCSFIFLGASRRLLTDSWTATRCFTASGTTTRCLTTPGSASLLFRLKGVS